MQAYIQVLRDGVIYVVQCPLKVIIHLVCLDCTSFLMTNTILLNVH